VIAPIQDVVFDHRGQYYAAVPLDFREEDYKKWLAQRTGPNAAEAIFRATSERPLEVSRYITSVFATLEGNDFVRLAEARDEGLDAPLIKQKLDQQGSVYAQADAFRLYRFREKAWARILMQSVGSSAAMSEEIAKRRRKEGTWERAPVQIPSQEGVYRGQAIAEDITPRPSVSEEVSRRPAIENHSEGVDADYDPDDYNQVLHGPSKEGGGSTGGGGQKQQASAAAPAELPPLGFFARFRKRLAGK
jgi:hypothetical protein